MGLKSETKYLGLLYNPRGVVYLHIPCVLTYYLLTGAYGPPKGPVAHSHLIWSGLWPEKNGWCRLRDAWQAAGERIGVF